MDKVQLIISTTAKFFISWFSTHWVSHRSIEYLKSETGHSIMTLQRPTISGNDNHYLIRIGGAMLYESFVKDSRVYTTPNDVIQIVVIQIDNERIELQFVYDFPFLWDNVLLPFLEEIKKYWAVTDVTIADSVSAGITRSAKEITRQQQEILDYWRDDYTYKEIAEIVQLSPGRVKNIITKLRNELGESEVPFHSRYKKKT